MRDARRILIAEDVPANATLYRAVLERAGYLVDVAAHGEAAVDKGTAHAYGLILMDLGLPLLDGFEAAQRIRQARPNAVIVALTADCDRKIEAACRAAGMRLVLTKPLGPSALLREVETLLEAAA